MKKTYLMPAMQVEQAMAAQMLAESLPISDTTVDGSNALTKEDNDWNIWNEEEQFFQKRLIKQQKGADQYQGLPPFLFRYSAIIQRQAAVRHVLSTYIRLSSCR